MENKYSIALQNTLDFADKEREKLEGIGLSTALIEIITYAYNSGISTAITNGNHTFCISEKITVNNKG
tara:strand:- start:526 stop:729 length:204 start_codon:yes stop_codon:yes gene_type:complete